MNARISTGPSATVRAIIAELRAMSIISEPRPDLPLPNDVDIEAELVAAVLEGYATPGELAPLVENHFYSRILGEIFCAADAVLASGIPLSDEAILDALEAGGVVGDCAYELQTLRLSTPASTSQKILRQQTERILELWRQRQAIAQLDRIVWSIRCGELAADAALKRAHRASW